MRQAAKPQNQGDKGDHDHEYVTAAILGIHRHTGKSSYDPGGGSAAALAAASESPATQVVARWQLHLESGRRALRVSGPSPLIRPQYCRHWRAHGFCGLRMYVLDGLRVTA